jgi:hypothetical protein
MIAQTIATGNWRTPAGKGGPTLIALPGVGMPAKTRLGKRLAFPGRLSFGYNGLGIAPCPKAVVRYHDLWARAIPGGNLLCPVPRPG